ncbi:sensor histidine kinase [Azospirillum doebereinerae]|uniref:histidine kinase n=1 Tax=Azospirillum doebereinerae TaxID=92933 RepID=A0A433JDM2_9PROT|nr:PAS domain-containing sensor histidine kinase [Azospirillum doebereinerae]MCG5239996.1 ATP-binding protein [Azospirillum doebereinerae]RUQ75007.1 PAS domain-containing sensor histidine kinase [Azospirillum doebereinerae]
MSNVVLPQPPDDLSTATIALLADAVGIFAALRGDDGAVIDFEWRLANPAAETLIGHGRLTGRRLRGDDLVPCCAELFAALVAALDGPVTRTLDLQGKGQAVVGRWRLSASPFPGGVCATLADLGPDRPSMAETLATALEHGAESFALFDADDRLIHATGRLKRFLPELADLLVPGVTFEALVRRTAWMDGALSTEAGRERWVEARLANHRHPDKPFTMRGQDGRWIMVREQRLPDGGVLVIHADVTPIKQTEEGIRTREAEARAARREAERASRAKSDFLAHMSHELRTPLNAVLGFSELLMSEAFGPLGSARYRAYANDIHDSGAHLLALIDDILDLSRIEAGRMPLSDENVDVTALSRQALTMLREKAAGKGVTLSTDIAADLPLLLGDQRAVRQMLVNLLSNAVKFTPAGGRAMVTASLMPDGGIGIMVADTGTGIPIDDLDRVLEPFERSDLAIARVTEGTGLGLPIVKRLVELHGGRLELLSEMGVGTSAVLTFPPSRSLPRNLYPPLPHSHRPNLAQPAGRQNASHKADVPKTDVPKTGG